MDMDHELVRVEKEAILVYLMYYPSISLEELR
jgi:hypothetical protein